VTPMRMDNKYGYRVCYREYGSNKLKVYLVTNSLDLALWHIRWYEHKPPPKLNKPEWEIKEITTKKQYEKFWRGCPFADDLS